MNYKEREKEFYRKLFSKQKKLCTEDTLKRMKLELELQKGAKRREQLYDAYMRGEVDVIRTREGNFIPSVLIKQGNSKET